MTWAVVAEIPGIEVSKATGAQKGRVGRRSPALGPRQWGPIQEVKVVDDLTAQDGVMRTEVTFECSVGRSVFLRIGPLARSASTTPSRSPAIMASIIAHDDLDHTVDATEVSFTPGVLETLLESLNLLAPGVDLGLPVPGQLAQLSDIGRGDEGGPHHPTSQPHGQPLGIGEIALAPRYVFYVLSITEPRSFEETLQGVVDRPPNKPPSPPSPRCQLQHASKRPSARPGRIGWSKTAPWRD